MEKLCLFCKHFYFNPGELAYSDVTPGSNMSIGCGKGHWNEDSFYHEESYRACQLKAQTCKDFNQIELPTKAE